MTTAMTNRNDEIRDIHNKYIDFYKISGGLSLIVIGIWIGTLFFSDGYATNVYTEFLSVAATIAVIDQLNRRRDVREREQYKKGLFRQVKSLSNDAAIEALDQIQHEGWWDNMLENYRDGKGRINLRAILWAGGVNLRGHNLQSANLRRANLQDADLRETNLQDADLLYAYLQDADLHYANLQHATLRSADLQHATLLSADLQHAKLGRANLQHAKLWDAKMQHVNLRSADLQHAKLVFAKLQHANLRKANLQHANLQYANMQHVNLKKANLQSARLQYANLRDVQNIEEALFNEKTVLPDAEKIGNDDERKAIFTPESYWTPETDMTRYTDPNHPDFWEPKWVKRQREKKQDG